MVRLQARLFPAASVAMYWTSVSPTGNREPGVWRLVTLRRPPKRQTYTRNKVITHLPFSFKWKLYSSHTADGSLGLFPFFRARLGLLVQRAYVKQKYAEMRRMSHLEADKKKKKTWDGREEICSVKGGNLTSGGRESECVCVYAPAEVSERREGGGLL